MLQYPYGVFPNGNTIDTSIPFNFSMFISGTSCIAYKLSILESVSGKSFYDGAKTILPQKIYNQEFLQITNNQPLETGREYIYNYILWTEKPDIPIVSGVILEQVSLTVFYIGQFSNIKAGHTIVVNGQSRIVKTYQFDEVLLKGVLTIDEPFDTLVGDNISFKIVSDFIETPFYYFISQNTPNLSFANIPSVVASRKFDFIGLYTQEQNISVQKYRYQLYLKSNEEYILLDSTSDIYSEKLTYNYDGFLNNENYKIVLIVTNQSEVEVSTEREFQAVYNEQISFGLLEATFIYENHSCLISVESDDSSIIYWELYRRENNSPITKYIGRIYPDTKTFEDYGVVNRKEYVWQAIPITIDFTAQVLTSNTISTNWGDWSILSLKNQDGKYTPSYVVKLNLNLESAEMVQNIDVVYHKNYTQYPKASQGVSNYLTGNISCLLGKIKSLEYSEEDFTISQWRDFVNNGELKLLKDRAGHKYLVSISTNSSSVDDASVQQLNLINFSFTEIGDADSILLEV